MMTFFIFSLPRSRTAWLANFLTHGNTRCFHEALTSCYRVSDLRSIFEGTKKPIVGNSDCLNVLVADDIMATFPESRIVVVERNLVEIEESLSALGSWNPDMLRWMLKGIEHVKTKYDPLVVPYKALSTPEGCKRVWDHCIGPLASSGDSGTPFDRRRWEMLDALNVQVDLEKHRVRVARNRDALDHLLRDFCPYRWIELAAEYMGQRELPSVDVPCSPGAMRQYLSYLDISEQQYRALTGASLTECCMFNPTVPLLDWVGCVLELVHEVRSV